MEHEQESWPTDRQVLEAEHNKVIQRADRLQAEVLDEERWMREVLTDFRIPFDDHVVGRRYAMICWMQTLQAEVERLTQRLEEVSIELIVAENQNVKERT